MKTPGFRLFGSRSRILGFVLTGAGLWATTVRADEHKQAAINLPPVCGVKLNAPRLHWEIFADVEGGLRQRNPSVVQRASDIFSWQDFIALNWPASGKRGIPAKDRSFAAPGPRVWETWKETGEVYLPDGRKPAPWDAPEVVSAAFSRAPTAKRLFRQTKLDKTLQAVFEPTVADGALPATLKDQRGEMVRFEIRMNRVLFDYVVDHKLYDARVQALQPEIEAPAGSILIKAAWRILGPEETGFHTTQAWVSDDANPSTAKYRLVRVGLVGFHIMHKTKSAPQWIWSTFEHVRNVTGPNASFFNPRCTECAINVQTPNGVPNQATRVIPIPSSDPDCDAYEAVDNLAALNHAVREALEGSPFRNYEQVGSQWPAPGTPATVFEVRPALLGNTTLETFIQNSSSCMGCHAMARTVQSEAFVSSDFTFTFSYAAPGLPPPKRIYPPTKPAMEDEKKSWTSILRGYQIATQTYEALPDNLPRSKLHCQSCHLDGGANPAAAWWVGMIAKYRYPETNPGQQTLMGRINQCFERSMNGEPLCANDDLSDPNMNALIDYMRWLDAQATALALPLPAGPFPPVAALTGDSDRGGRIFLQKCAFCHGADGAGRYESNVYYRPALWGPHSYNQQAGLFANKEYLPAFLKGNMPLGSGGELTDQEARDLAAFVNNTTINARPVGDHNP